VLSGNPMLQPFKGVTPALVGKEPQSLHLQLRAWRRQFVVDSRTSPSWLEEVSSQIETIIEDSSRERCDNS
jgi:hypothetical protein